MPHAARRAEVEYKGIVPRDLMRNPHSVLGVIGVIAVPFEPCVPFVPFGGQLASPFFSTSDPFSQFGLPIWPPHLVALRLLGDPQAPSALRPFNSLSHTRPRITLSRWRCLGDTVRQPVPPWSSSPSLPFPLLAPSTRFPPPAPASPPDHLTSTHSIHLPEAAILQSIPRGSRPRSPQYRHPHPSPPPRPPGRLVLLCHTYIVRTRSSSRCWSRSPLRSASWACTCISVPPATHWAGLSACLAGPCPPPLILAPG
ncbi:hypothetical protein BKA56DRAFT_567120 [Ilyonectria sp. MPI-CAGE-AT-0026]|nr:hypothetical protein BKA56DRAFT_567120 [Ilyonectria sp. MPI-CAGE-AT-0026]